MQFYVDRWYSQEGVSSEECLENSQTISQLTAPDATIDLSPRSVPMRVNFLRPVTSVEARSVSKSAGSGNKPNDLFNSWDNELGLKLLRYNSSNRCSKI